MRGSRLPLLFVLCCFAYFITDAHPRRDAAKAAKAVKATATAAIAAVEHFGRAVAMMDAEGSKELARAVRTNMALSLEKAGEINGAERTLRAVIDGAAAASDKGACVADAGGTVGPPAAVR